MTLVTYPPHALIRPVMKHVVKPALSPLSFAGWLTDELYGGGNGILTPLLYG